MKIQLKALSLLGIFLLTSCGSVPTSNPNTDSSSEPILVDDSELTKYDELRDTYDNAMSVPSVVSTESPDPFIYRYNGTYYLYMTTNGNRIRCYESKDMLDWQPAIGGASDGICYDYNADSYHPDASTPYAPEVFYLNGKFYLITSPGGKGHYILEADAPYGPYSCITDNFGASIDGSFFMDSNEDIYLYTAAGGPIAMYKLDDDMTFLSNEDGTTFHSSYLEANMGAWNEGPFMLQRNGGYYFTWCGTHYLSDSYHVDYCYAAPESDISKSSAFSRQDTLVIDTSDGYKGLGHSCMVLGPDLDSEYVVYHELQTGRRNLCFSRLSFDGSKMIANDVKRDSNFVPAIAEFNAYSTADFTEEGNFYLSDYSSKDEFTAEFNVIGEGKMYFSFIDSNNYSYIEFINNIITINQVENGNNHEITRIPLIKKYSPDFNHTFRITYRNGLFNFYFDQMEKAYDVKANFKGGKIGLDINNDYYDVGYCGLSLVGKDGSDKKEYNTKQILANAFDTRLSYLRSGSGLKEVTSTTDYVSTGSHNLLINNEGDRATYRVYAIDSNDYDLYMRLPASSLNKTIGVRVDDGQIQNIKLTSEKPRYKSSDTILDLGSFSLNEGQHNISIYNVGDSFEFSELELHQYSDAQNVDETFTTSTRLSNYYVKNELSLTNNGVQTGEDIHNFITTKESFANASISSLIKVNKFSENGYVGLMVNVNDCAHNVYADGEYRNGNNDSTWRGLLFSVDKNGQVLIKNMDYNFSKSVMISDFEVHDNMELKLEVYQSGNHFTFLINDDVVADFYSNISMMYGQAGVVSYMTNSLIQNLIVEQ